MLDARSGLARVLPAIVGLSLFAPVIASAQLDPGAASRAPEHVRRGADGRVRLARGLARFATGATAEERAQSFLRVHGSDFDLDGLDLVVADVREAHGLTVVVLRRHVAGEPVHRRSVRLRYDERGVVDLLVSEPGPRAANHARRSVSDAFVARRAEALSPFARPRAHVSRVWLELGGRLVRGFVAEVDGAALTQRAELLFDGDGRLVAAGPRTVHALGRVYLPNPVVAMDETSDVELSNLTSADRLAGAYISVSSCPATGPCDPVQSAVADASGDFLYDPADPAYDDPFSEVSAYYHSDLIAAYFRDQHDFTWNCCDMTTVLGVVANYTEAPGRPYDNAAYSPSACTRSQCGTIVLGQGPLRDYSYDGDVVYHEYTHAVVDALANIAGFDLDDLGISYEPGALNEGSADYFSATLAGNASVAEYFSGSGSIGTSGALRDLENDLRCPNDLFGEGHFDGRIWGGTGWAIREAIGPISADALMYTTLAAMVDNTDLAEAGDLLLATAQAFETAGRFTPTSTAIVFEEVAARGLLGCRRIVPLDDSEEHLGYSGTGFATGTIGGSVAPTHYSIDIPVDATSLTLDVVPATATGEYTAFFRDGESLRFIGIRLLHDAEVPVDGPVVLGLGDDPHPLPRCRTLYIGLRADDLTEAGESIYSIRATLERSGDPTAECPELPIPDAGTDGGDGGADGGDGGSPDADSGPTMPPGRLGGGGCQCDAAMGVAPILGAWPLVVVVGLLAVYSRRRR